MASLALGMTLAFHHHGTESCGPLSIAWRASLTLGQGTLSMAEVAI